MRGPYLSRGVQYGTVKVTTLRKIVRTPTKNSNNLVFFFGHLPVIDRIFLAMNEFFFGHNDRKKFANILV